ncbi:glycosyltransferase family 2 protein [Nakamurella antarctica]|uniref:Glycosyltransferase family 2 protein n=1 Tax=Nakamurella antarctica TaxID=1902245 RepID=A0A3G8ZJG0_9ACTN|nr:glycosyltransferase family A protein [Nakamurella antarctica]AZI57350.1 glycosyltransferase family 2 protein [Nakamurella antarctica]
MTAPVNPPLVSVIIATRGRPELLRVAVRAILAQDYEGPIELIVVYDNIEIDRLGDIEVPARRSLTTISNARTQGLAGGRNTGIEAAHGEYVAFCDDDDHWLAPKLSRQMAIWESDPHAALVGSGIRIHTEKGEHVRLPPRRVMFADLLKSRITELHPSGFLMRRSGLVSGYGLVDEELPASYGEDYDLLLRAARTGPVLSVTEPLVIVNWNRPSFFSGKWEGIAAGLTYLLNKFPEFETSPAGTSRIAGQIAFAHAALGNRPAAKKWARLAIGGDRRQLRAYAAYAVAARLAPAGLMVRLVNLRGRGL